MTSPLAGNLALTIGKAMGSLFLPATLTRGTTTYPCKAIYDQWGTGSGPGGAVTNPDVKALVLAQSLAVQPASGDVVSLQGSTFVVVSNSDTKPAVSTDPARAVWTLIGKFSPIGAGILQSYAATAAAIGLPYQIFHSTGSNPLSTPSVETTPVVVTSAKSSGFDYKRSSTFDDTLFALQADFTNIHIGDYLVGSGGTFFIADMPALRPVVAVQCNRVVNLLRQNSQVAPAGGSTGGMPSQSGSTGTYWGKSSTPQTTTTGAGEDTLISGVPCNVIGTAGRATGTGEDPSGPPGPSRWRFYMPQSAFPKGSLQDGDILVDEEGNRHMVSAAYWSSIGYRAEAVREEVQG